MKPLRISFANTWSQRLLGRGSRWERNSFVVALLIALAALVWVAWERHVLGLEQARLKTALDQAQAPSTRPVPRPSQPATPAEALRQMDAVTARLNVPWSDVLDAIERSTTQKVALLTLEPDARTGSVSLTTEARSLDDLLNYAEALGQDAAVASVRMGQHDLREQEPGQPVRMTLSISPVPLRQ
jgi:Tfp pilus assembly protein PilN